MLNFFKTFILQLYFCQTKKEIHHEHSWERTNNLLMMLQKRATKISYHLKALQAVGQFRAQNATIHYHPYMKMNMLMMLSK